MNDVNFSKEVDRLNVEILFLENKIKDLNRIIHEKDLRIDNLIIQSKTYLENLDIYKKHCSIMTQFNDELQAKIKLIIDKKTKTYLDYVAQDAVIDY